MKKIKTDKLLKKHIQYLYSEGIDLENFKGGFVADLTAEVTTLPNCFIKMFTQVGDEPEMVDFIPMTVGEYFETKKRVNGADYVYAQIRKASGFLYPNPKEFRALVDFFGEDNIVTEEEWDSLEEVIE